MSRTVRLPLVVAAVLLAGALGLILGSRLPWGKVSLTVEPGVAVLHDPEGGFTSFDGADGAQFGFDLESIVWSTDRQEGDGGAPPCLRQGEQVPVEVGYRWVRLPDGGARPFVLWLRC